ncbi:response regulator [Bremerella sp. T1]|uniref:response regulator n=1 Tax=Bremerella sp. TYQ1 TaxID=3119568 RepID=UPI001CC99E26|nr:response regulator [Bremerella volcania]UBM33857.1 response regulator [Bremerella volcania]
MKNKPSILLVDDEPDILHSLIGLLRRQFTVHTATSGEEALQIMAEHPIAVLMTDQRMPEMTGAELASHCCRRFPKTTRILFTGYADIKSVIEAINTGGLYRYVTKPWDPDELIDLLTEAVEVYEKETAHREMLHQMQRYVGMGQQISQQLRLGQDGQTIDQDLLQSFTETGNLLEELANEPCKPAAGE